ncbi:MAG: iron-sulfur cluster assembly accessory protein [Candidatus Palauibacterales bacterium]|nr:iron-sulfur cluster assembly accessory protein [Candidatus Palauibacterales bacterium]MDP2528879.1 iron-sulfur cluster assembly accessory protein [Candidatus Palauibacterales bacterium]
MDTTVQSGQGESLGITLSEVAAGEVRKFMSEEKMEGEAAGLRVSVVPGGCSGFEYALNLEPEARDDDFVLGSHGVRLFIDPFSAQYLEGVSIDYQSTFQGSGFTFDNPNATGGCGCGSSFAV